MVGNLLRVLTILPIVSGKEPRYRSAEVTRNGRDGLSLKRVAIIEPQLGGEAHRISN